MYELPYFPPGFRNKRGWLETLVTDFVLMSEAYYLSKIQEKSFLRFRIFQGEYRKHGPGVTETCNILFTEVPLVAVVIITQIELEMTTSRIFLLVHPLTCGK